MTDDEYATKLDNLFLLWEPRRSNVVALHLPTPQPAPLAEEREA